MFGRFYVEARLEISRGNKSDAGLGLGAVSCLSVKILRGTWEGVFVNERKENFRGKYIQ